MISGAPQFVNQRLHSVYKYAWSSLFPGDSLNDRLKRIKTQKARNNELKRYREIVQELSYVLYLFFLNRFLKEGAEAARKTVDVFQEHGVEGFQIGSQVFIDRNENVMKGDDLSEKLLSAIEDDSLLKLIKESKYAYQIIDEYKPFLDKTQDG